MPPGIARVVNNFTTNFQQLNEQSMMVKFCNLKDGDARAIFKNTNLDLRSYKRLKMFAHLEGTPDLRDKQVSAFMRLGNDFTSNYYEYEIPLTVTPDGYYNPNSEAEVQKIWPLENEFDIELSELSEVKIQRNLANYDKNLPFTIINSKGHKITIKGNPNIGILQTVMLGVRNPQCSEINPGVDDCLPKCGQIWFNELRLTDFDNSGGWAARGTLNMKLADLGTVNISGLRKTIGYGNVDSKVSDRNRLDTKEYGIAGQFDLSKFFPVNWAISMPVNMTFSESFQTPMFNPLDPDLRMSSLKTRLNPEERDQLFSIIQDYTRRKGINFTNVRKNKSPNATLILPISLSNFDFTYSFNEMLSRNFEKQWDINRLYNAAIGYNYAINSKPIKPFGFLKTKSKHLAFIKDFSFAYLPTNITYRISGTRTYNELALRDNSEIGNAPLDVLYNKNFTLDRNFSTNYNPFPSLQIQFQSNHNGRVDEPNGPIDTKEKRDTIVNNLLNLGRDMGYNHTANASYNLPFSKIPTLNFITSSVRYGSTYGWQSSTLAAPELGHTITNSQSQQLNNTLNFVQLYNKSNFLKTINNNQPFKFYEEKKKREEEKKKLEGKKPETKKPETSVNQFGEKVTGGDEGESKDKKKEKEPIPLQMLRYSVRMLMSLRNVSANYTITNGTMIPGFNQRPDLLGNNWTSNAPGLAFAFGDQKDLRPALAQNNWIVTDSFLTGLYNQTSNQNLSLRALVEPIRDFRIELNASKNTTYGLQTNFRFDQSVEQFKSFNPIESGNYTVSTITWRTVFEKIDKNENSNSYLVSNAFNTFEKNRFAVSQSLHNGNPNSTSALDSFGFYDGYSKLSPDVLIPAFIAAYTGKDISKSSSAFPNLPLPNWRVTYSGLSKSKKLSKYFNSITFNHAYVSTYSASNYLTNLLHSTDMNNNTLTRDTLTGNFYPKYQIGSVTISEQLQPLAGFDFTTKKNITGRIEYKKSRTLTLSLLNNRLSEMNNTEFTVGAGFKIAGKKLPLWMTGGKKLSNDLDCRFDFNIRDNHTIIRDLDAPPTPSAGIRTVSIKPNINYQLNQRVSFRLFFDRVATKPFTSLSFPTANTNGGFSIRFTLAN